MTNTEKKNWGEAYFDHYSRFLGKPSEQLSLTFNEEVGIVQALCYSGVIDRCWAIATLGLSKCVWQSKCICEVFCVVDANHRGISEALLQGLRALVENGADFGWGTAVSGLGRSIYQSAPPGIMNGLYFSQLINAPGEFAEVNVGGKHGVVFSAIPISDAEYAYFMKFGAGRFESLLSEAQVDVVDMTRASIV